MNDRTTAAAGAGAAPRARDYHHGNLKAALLSAALARLGRQGHAVFSLSELAREVHVTPAAAYRHFANKDELLIALAAHGFDEMRALFESSVSLQRPPASAVQARRRFKALAEAYLRFAIENPGLIQLMFGVEGEPFRARIRQAPSPTAVSTFVYLETCLRELHRFGIAARRPSATDAWFVWCAMHGAALLAVSGTTTLVPQSRIAQELTRRMVALLRRRET